MVLKLRLTRRGRTGVPVYWLVAAHSAVKRDGIFKSKLGVYAPLSPDKKLTMVDESKLLVYLKNGAVPTDTVVRLLTKYCQHETMQAALTRYPLRKDRCAKSAL